MMPRLSRYLELERLMLILDEAGDVRVADALRDAMDPIWHELSDEERRLLDDRNVGRIVSLEEIRVPAGSDVFGSAPSPSPHSPLPNDPITDWTLAA